MNFAADHPVFLADFGIDAIIGTKIVRGIFDADYAEAFDIVSGSQPSLLCLTTDIADMARGASIVIGDVGYTVEKPPQPDGTGMTRLMLRKT